MPNPLELIEELPPQLPYAKRFRARRPRLGVEVELRVVVGSEGSPKWRHFLQEKAALESLDHPAFPPVVDQGHLKGRPYYAIPMRELLPLSDFMGSRSLSVASRCRILESLASALAAAHRRYLHLGGLHPRVLFLQAEEESIWLPWPLGMRTTQTPPGLPEFPPGLKLESMLPMELDVSRWGQLAFGLLAPGEPVFDPETKAIRPLRRLCRPVRRALAKLIEASLAPEIQDRPSHGLELFEALHQLRLSTDPDASVRGTYLSEVGNLDLTQTLESMRKTQTLDLAKSVDGAFPKIDEMKDLLEPLMQRSRDWYDDQDRSRQRMIQVLPVLILGIYLFGEDLGALFTRGGRNRVETIQGIDTQNLDASYAQDPHLQRLLDGDPSTPETVAGRITLLRNLAFRRRLPPSFQDPSRFEALARTVETNPARGAEALDHLLEELRIQVRGGA